MVEYIDRMAIIRTLSNMLVSSKKRSPAEFILHQIIEIVSRMKKEDVAPVVHSHWIITEDDYQWDEEQDDEIYVVLERKCARCGRTTRRLYEPNYCDNCGAKMDGGVNDGK